MSNKPFHYQDPFPLKKDDTEYYLLSRDHVSVSEFEGQEILKVAPEALTLLAQHAFHDASFMLRPAHQQQVADILDDPDASENDKYVALQFLRNSEIAAKGILPTCQDTGTAIIVGKKGQRVWTGGGDEEALSRGVYNTYIEENLRYSQNAALDMYKEVNTGSNLPAQIDLYSVDGEEYKFLCIAKGGGSANKTYLYQETKALLSPGKLKNYLVDKMRTLGTAACPPYHVAFVIGGTSAEATLKTVKLASTKYYDGLPTEGNEHGQAFRDLELEAELLQEAQTWGWARSSAANTSRTISAWCACRATARPARSAWAFPARQTATSKARLTATASGWKNWSTIRVNSFLRSCARPGKARRSRSISTVRWPRSSNSCRSTRFPPACR
jgi:fumarate hydratase class I